ncbi:uncharacterized protein LOC143930799 isoform X1 [Lithobates pipiens]
MFYSVAVLTLLVLTWAEQGSSNPCNGKSMSPKMRELFATLDEAETAVCSILHSPEDKHKIITFNKKIKSKLCDMEISTVSLMLLKKIHADIPRDIKNGKITEEKIVEFMKIDPVKNFDELFEQLMEEVNAEAKKIT